MNIEGMARTDLSDRFAAMQEAESIDTPPGQADTVSALIAEGDMGAQIAAMTILSAKNQRELNRELGLVQETAIERAEAAQVQAMHDKADAIRASGWVEGGFGMVSGACTFASASTPKDSGPRVRWEGAASGSDALGKIFGGCTRGAEADLDATATQHEHQAKRAQRNLEATQESIAESRTLTEHALDFYKQYRQSENQAADTSVRRR